MRAVEVFNNSKEDFIRPAPVNQRPSASGGWTSSKAGNGNMSDSLEQVIMQYHYYHTCKTKAPAMRAAKKMAHRSLPPRSLGFPCWDDDEIRHGFHGCIRFTPDMIVVEQQTGCPARGRTGHRGRELRLAGLEGLICTLNTFRRGVLHPVTSVRLSAGTHARHDAADH